MKEHIGPLLKWWWLLLLAALITGASAYLVARPLPPVYLARATLLVGHDVSQPDLTGNDLGFSQQLAAAYVDVANREPIQNAALQALGLPALPPYTARANGTFVEI